MAENSEIPTIGALKYTRELPIKEFSSAGNLIWTFNSSIGGVLAFASISEIARYDSQAQLKWAALKTHIVKK